MLYYESSLREIYIHEYPKKDSHYDFVKITVTSRKHSRSNDYFDSITVDWHWKCTTRNNMVRVCFVFEFRFHSVFPTSHAYASRKFNLLPEVKSSHVLWIAIFPADKQIMHLPSDHVSKIHSYHFPDTRTRSTIRSSDRAFTVDRLLRRERVHFVHTCYIVNSPTWTIISHSAERLCTEFQIVPTSPTQVSLSHGQSRPRG